MPFGLPGFIARWLAALFLVFATYNPSGYSYCDWIADLGGGQWVLKALVTIVLIIYFNAYVGVWLEAALQQAIGPSIFESVLSAVVNAIATGYVATVMAKVYAEVAFSRW